MAETADFYYEVNSAQPLSLEVVAAIAEAHDEEVIDQKWRISDGINTDALDGLFEDHKPNITLQFEADAATVTIVSGQNGSPVIKIDSHR